MSAPSTSAVKFLNGSMPFSPTPPTFVFAFAPVVGCSQTLTTLLTLFCFFNCYTEVLLFCKLILVQISDLKSMHD